MVVGGGERCTKQVNNKIFPEIISISDGCHEKSQSGQWEIEEGLSKKLVLEPRPE